MEDILKGHSALENVMPAPVAVLKESLSRKRSLPRFFKEPFLHFIILGGIIYTAAHYYKAHTDQARFTISLSDQDVLRIASLWEKQYGSIPSKKQLTVLVDNYVREEIFYREGVAMELDKTDEVIKRRIAQKYEFLQEDLTIIDEPVESDLISYFNKNKELYRIPEKITFTHIYFSPDQGGDEQAIARANRTREALIVDHISRAPDRGDTFPFLYDYTDVDETQLQRLMGEAPLTQKAFTLATHEWSQPLQSAYGYHLLYVTEKVPSLIPDYSSVRAQLRTDFLEAQRQEKNNGAYEMLLSQYSVERPEIHELNP